jgi:hypothetical protein
MKQLFVSALLLAVIPMALLNPLGRDAFIGYYAGVIAMWFVFACVGRLQRVAQPLGTPR